MSGMADMARMMAAGGGDGGMSADGAPPDMEAQDPNAPEDGPEMGGGDADAMIEQGIAMIEGALDGLPGDLAEKARKHLEGLKEIAAQSEAAEGSPDDQENPMDQEPAGANAGQMESPSEPQVGGSAQGFGA